MTVAGSSSEGSVAPTSRSSKFWGASSTVFVEVLGRSIFDRTVDTLNNFETLPPRTISEGSTSGHFLPRHNSRANSFVSAWEEAVASYVRDGVDHLLLLRVNSYHELDYNELLHFHLQSQSALTQVYASDGSLDIALVNAAPLRLAESCLAAVSALIPRQRRFYYNGYVNRLRDPREVYSLVSDALHRRCELKPAGNEVREGVWLGAGCQVDASATINAPVFIGAGTRIAPFSTVADASIEANCEVDCGTSVSQSWLLQNTYVGMALHVHSSVVRNARLFHRERNVELKLDDKRLLGPRKKSGPLLGKIESLLGYQPQQGD